LDAHAVDVREQVGDGARRPLDLFVEGVPLGDVDLRRLIRASAHVSPGGDKALRQRDLMVQRDSNSIRPGADIHRDAFRKESGRRHAEGAHSARQRERRQAGSIGCAVRGSGCDRCPGDRNAVGRDAHDDGADDPLGTRGSRRCE
jgi:hypothetical protein